MKACVTAVAVLLMLCAPSVADPAVKVVSLDAQGGSYLRLLKGPPETRSFRSGLVILKPGEAVGEHTTGRNEEMLIPLEGQGELRVEGLAPIHIAPGLVTYTPPQTRHNVVNTGATPLRYIYVTAKAD